MRVICHLEGFDVKFSQMNMWSLTSLPGAASLYYQAIINNDMELESNVASFSLTSLHYLYPIPPGFLEKLTLLCHGRVRQRQVSMELQRLEDDIDNILQITPSVMIILISHM